MDDLKLYAKGESQLEELKRIMKGFSDDIGIEFGLGESVKATFQKNRL